MNERIKQLALEARLVRNGDFGMKRWEGPQSDSINDQDLEKFAELIVRECSRVYIQNQQDGVMTLTQDLLQHFGVNDNSIKVGGRIKVVSKFNVGARGTVNYIEPSGKLWVRRDGASSDVSYYPTEVIGVD